MSETILVTGGAGFIGSHVCEHLVERGSTVIAIDNFDPYYDPSIKRQNLAGLIGSEHFQLYEGDIRDLELLEKIANQHPIDAIIHLAAKAGVRPSLQDPAEYADVNLTGTVALLELARRHEIGRFIFASSSSVYGERNEVPFRESDPVEDPVSPYAATKRAGETVVKSYHLAYGIDASCLRFFTVYGPRQRPEMAIHSFLRRLDQGEPIPVFGDGSSRRDYTYIDDIVAGILLTLDNHRGFDIYNLGNHRMVRLDELLELIGEAYGRTPAIDRQGVQQGDVSQTCADVSHSREKLGYSPSTPIEIGLSHFVDWYLNTRIAVTQ